MGKRRLGLSEGKSELSLSMKVDLAELLATRAALDQRTQSACLDRFIEVYMRKELPPLPEGAKVQRAMAGTGETRLRRYRVEPKTVRLLQEAETLGYSQSYVIEEALKEGLATDAPA